MNNEENAEQNDRFSNNSSYDEDEAEPELQIFLDVGNIMSRFISNSPIDSQNIPTIRKKPELRTFRHTSLYKETKALSGYPPTYKRPSDYWSLLNLLSKRESGTAKPCGAFSVNQQRRILNSLFIPNNKECRLMSLDAKVFVSKFNRDGSKLITGSQDSLVRIYDSSKATYHRILRLKVPDVNWSILDIDFSPCGNYFAYSTWTNYFFVVPVSGGVERVKWYELETSQQRNAIFSLRYSPTGEYLIGACSNSCVYLSNLETKQFKTVQTKGGSHVDLNAISYLSDCDPNLFLCACNSGIIKLYDIRDRCFISDDDRGGGVRRLGIPASSFIGHLDGITYIDARNDGKHFLTNSKDQSIKLWDIRKPAQPSKVLKHRNGPLYAWDYRWDIVPQGYYNPRAMLDGDVSIMTYRGHRVTKTLLRAKFSPIAQTGQRYIYTGCGTGRIIIYDVLTGLIKEAIDGHRDIIRDLSWHPIRAEIVSSSWDHHVNLNTFKSNPLIKRKLPSEDNVNTRRSRRLANRNGELDTEAVEEDIEISTPLSYF